MSCDQIANELTLYLYGELTQEEEERVEHHLAGCGGCAAELGQLRLFERTMSAAQDIPTEALLQQCRMDLARTLRVEKTLSIEKQAGGGRRSWFARAMASTQEFMNMGVGMRVPAGALALIAVGFLAGKVAPGGGILGSSLFSGAQQASSVSVRSVEPDASGKVRISYDNLSRRQLSGDWNDPKVRELLLAGLKDESNPGLRVEAASVMKDHAGDTDVREALMSAVQHDPNVGVRMSALDALRPYGGDPAVRKALTEVLLNDGNAGVRVKVIDLLTAHKDDSLVGPLQNQMQKEDNSYVRMRITKTLRELNASVGTF